MNIDGISQANTALCGPFNANAIVISVADCARARLLPGVLAEIVCDRLAPNATAIGHVWPGPGVADGQAHLGANLFRLVRATLEHLGSSAVSWRLSACQAQAPPAPASGVSLAPIQEQIAAAGQPSIDSIKLHLSGAFVSSGMAVLLPVSHRDSRSPAVPPSSSHHALSPVPATPPSPSTPAATTAPTELTEGGAASPSTPRRWSPSSATAVTPPLKQRLGALHPFVATIAPAAPTVHQFLSSWTRVDVRSSPLHAAPPAAAAGEHSAHSQAPKPGHEAALKHVIDAVQLVFRPEAWQVFHASSGCAPPRGVLLHGPPGTGKSTLAKQAAASLGARLVRLDGVQLAGQAPHLARASIAEAFGLQPDSLQPDTRVQWFHPAASLALRPSAATGAQADDGADDSDNSTDPANATVTYMHTVPPRVVVVDELDALAPAGEDEGGAGGGASAASASLLSTLKTCITNSYRSSHVLPIALLGTTNRPEAVHPSVVGPSGFAAQVPVPPPSSTGRLALLQSIFPPHLHAEQGVDMPCAQRRAGVQSHPHSLSDEQLRDIADSSNGYVAADLAALANEAALNALQRHTHGSSAAVCISAADVAAARSAVQPSALRELQVDVPRTAWGDIAGAQDAKRALQETVQWPLQHPELFMQAGVSPPVGVLLYGPPGTGKTLLAKALAHETRANFVSVKGPELFSMYVGDSEKAVQRVFRQAAAVAPCVVFIDEVDAMGQARGARAEGGSNVADRVLNQLLTEMDTLHHAFRETVAAGGDAADWLANRVVVVAATNRPDTLDSALVRPGRLEQLVYVGLPDTNARETLLRHALSKAAPDAVAPDVDLGAVAALLQRASGAECAGAVRSACLAALQRDVQAAVVTQADLEEAARASVPQCTSKLLQWYETWKQQ